MAGGAVAAQSHLSPVRSGGPREASWKEARLNGAASGGGGGAASQVPVTWGSFRGERLGRPWISSHSYAEATVRGTREVLREAGST